MHHSACRVISCNYQPRFLVAVRDSITMPFEWYMPLQHMPHSGVLAWPVNIIKMKPGIHIVEFKAPAHDDMKPHVLPIMGISSGLIKAAPFHWKSWLWQCHHADGRGKLKPGVRPVILGQLENDVATVASKKAWFQLGAIDLTLICKDFCIPLQSGTSLFALCFAMVKFFLACSDEEALQYVRQRLQETVAHETTCSALHEIEEAVQVLDMYDEQMVDQAKEDDLKRRERRQMFKDGYRAKAQALFLKNGGKPPKQYKLKHNMKQEEAKKTIPPGSSIWQNRVVPGWCGHVLGFSRCSAAFHIHGSQQKALEHILRLMWTDHLELHGLPKSFCPVAGLV